MHAKVKKIAAQLGIAAVIWIIIGAAALIGSNGAAERQRLGAAADRAEEWLSSAQAIDRLKAEGFPYGIYETGISHSLKGVALENLSRMEHVMDTAIYGDVKAAVGYTKRAADINEGPPVKWIEDMLDRMDKKAKILQSRGISVAPARQGSAPPASRE